MWETVQYSNTRSVYMIHTVDRRVSQGWKSSPWGVPMNYVYKSTRRAEEVYSTVPNPGSFEVGDIIYIGTHD